MRKGIFAIAAFSVFLMSCPAQAAIKFDVAATAGKITETVSGWLETAKKKMDESETLQTLIAYGKGAKEAMEAVKGLQEDVEGAIDETKQAVNDAKNSVTAVADEAAASVGELSDEVASTGGVIGKVNAQIQGAQQLLALKEEKAQIESQMEEDIAAAAEEINAKIKLADDNIAKLREMMVSEPDNKDNYDAQIASYQKQKSDYQNELSAKEREIRQSGQERLASVNSQIETLRNETASKAVSAAKDKIGGLLKQDEETAAAINAVIQSNFLAEDEPETSENVARIKAYRNYMALRDTVDALYKAVQIKKTRYQDDNNADQLADKGRQLESATAAISMDTKLKIENMKSLVAYTELLLQDMKMRTASELAQISVYKLKDYSRDPTQFSLDDYTFSKDDIKQSIGQEKLKKMSAQITQMEELTKQMENNAKAAQDLANNAKNTKSDKQKAAQILNSIEENAVSFDQTTQNLENTLTEKVKIQSSRKTFQRAQKADQAAMRAISSIK